PTNATSLPLGSCALDIPCSNGACCNGASGFCGFGDDFCGAGVCTSNCNAQAECGKDAPPQNTTCPLVSALGTMHVFQDSTTRQERLLQQIRILRYHRYAMYSSGCMAYSPEKISAETLTHINFAFALISNSFNVVEMAAGDTDLWKRTTALKSRNPTLKVYLSIGGWTFNDPPTSRIFSEMVASDANTQTFISSVLHVFESYGFDGLDVDWEYPAANDRGGVPEDTQNYVTFMAKVKKAFSGPGYGLTFTAPSSYWYLQHFDLPGLLESADWVNVMTYDLHGFWDGKDIWIGPIVAAHTNLTEIDEAFKLYWRVGVQSSQMVMGFGFYGRSFTLASGDCPDPGCIWASGGNAGPCSGQSGILMYNEIQTILDRTVDKCDGNAPNSVSCASAGSSPAVTLPVFDEEAAVKYIRWDDNQWVSYDDADSFAVKMNYANDHCIGGSMIWSMDQDDDNNACPLGQMLLTTDIQGDADQPCSGSGTRSYCCILGGRITPSVIPAPIPFDDIFDPSQVPEGSLTFQEEFDPDEGIEEEGKIGAGSHSMLPNDQEENESAFGEVFLDSPNSNSVSSLELKTNWVITSCHPTSDRPQEVPIYCSKGLSSSECSHVMIGGAEHTIVKMPQNCGRGPYARVASLDLHPDQNVLSSYHQSRKPANEPVYLLKFDYSELFNHFAVIPEANGPVYMRADVTDMPGYWDTVVDSPPERKRWYLFTHPPNIDERWWGTFTNWLSKMNQVEKDASVSRNFHWSDTWTIFHKEVSCPGPPEFNAEIDISLTGQASLNSRYGIYIQGTVVPPAVSAAYVYFSADAKATGQFTLRGEASVRYDSSSIQFAKFGFPGLYYPGLLTIGPTLVISGYVSGEMSLSGYFTSTLSYTFPSVSFNFGKTDPDQNSGPVSPSSEFLPSIDLAVGYNVELTGNIHLVPSLQLGLSVLGGAVIDAQAFVDIDLYAGVRINGSVSDTIAPNFCIGACTDGGLTGNVLYWETGPLTLRFYSNEQEAFGQARVSQYSIGLSDILSSASPP
ncbi:hypothetical protein DFH08DRAFT_725187, partial [Mycena albidolilacea]